MSIALVTRGIVLLVFTALAGLASSLLLWLSAPAYAVRAALFGAVLGLGVLVTDRLSQERLRKGQYPEPVLALVVAVLTGLAAGGLLQWHGNAILLSPRYHDESPGGLFGGPLLIMSVAYALLLHGIYAVRGLVKRPHLTTLLGSIVAGVLCAALRIGLFEATGRLGGETIIAFAWLFMLFGSVPFCCLWMIAVRITDPGWSPQHWAKSIKEKAER